MMIFKLKCFLASCQSLRTNLIVEGWGRDDAEVWECGFLGEGAEEGRKEASSLSCSCMYMERESLPHTTTTALHKGSKARQASKAAT
jgi:hypothetical protein